MEPIKSLTAFYLMALSWGFFLFNPLANPKLTGGGFLRLVFALSGVLFLLFWGMERVMPFPLMMGVFVCILILYLMQKDQRSIYFWPLYFIGNILFVLISSLLFAKNYLGLLHFYSVMGLSGIVIFAMVLGHWYLVTPKLSEKPLLNCMYVFWALMLLKILFIAVKMPSQISYFYENTDLGGGYLFNWMMLLMRVGWGIVALLILSYFTFRLINLRSIQSATGVLYVMVFFVLIGELISLYFAQHYGLYL